MFIPDKLEHFPKKKHPYSNLKYANRGTIPQISWLYYLYLGHLECEQNDRQSLKTIALCCRYIPSSYIHLPLTPIIKTKCIAIYLETICFKTQCKLLHGFRLFWIIPVLCDSFVYLSFILVLPYVVVCLHLHDITI